ncbi:MAG TPA: class I SAM-dependent DNA methyltransferase [Haliscomenobacter sp.]|uniref:class I SAM-dependent DNA methyltransferase n=1 Tax=Haliscomenobacter sp. TaxID=2717303 RepID=UPI002C2CB9FA|nr:class I SAM-dependent DNA methyltransferase [Haliscomenobacter sp.]HOY17769.1 class I SAM-dependent DNA methyltransferase [Haliscomenobacter sp.]
MAKGTKKELKSETTGQRLSGLIKSCRQIMRKDKGMNGDADRLPMLTWIMFLKFMDDVEQEQETKALLKRQTYQPTIESPYRWRDWAKNHNLTGDDFLSFINNENCTLADGTEGAGLFYYLRSLQSESGNSRKDVIGTVFKGITNRMINGYLLRDVVNKIDSIHFNSTEEVFTLSHLYESILKEMRDASGDAGEFYTPRPVVKFMVEMLHPQLGESVLDPAAGTGGFLVEAFEHLRKQVQNTEQYEILQTRSIIGGEAKPLPYLLCQMNLLLHGLEFPHINSGNSLIKPLKDIGDSERVDIILTNPPFGGEEERGILNNFPEDMRSAETAMLFLQLIMRKLRRAKVTGEKGGRAAVVVPNGTLFADGIAGRIKEQMLKDFNLHTIVRLPDGVFEPYTSIPANLLFFEHGQTTEKVWFYEIAPPTGRKKYSKTAPMQFEEFDEIKAWWNARTESDQAWQVPIADVLQYDTNGKLLSANLDRKNPNRKTENVYIEPALAIAQILENEQQIVALMEEIKILL